MPGRRPQATRVGHHKARPTRATLPPTPVVQLRPFAKIPPPPGGWHGLTAEWWDTVRTSSVASQYTRIHEQIALQSVYMVDLYYKGPTERLGQRLAVINEELGLTDSAQRRREWTIPLQPAVTPAKAAVPPPPRRVRRSVLRSVPRTA